MFPRHFLWLILAAAAWLAAPARLAAQATPAPEIVPLGDLLGKVGQSQHRGGWFRDRCVYYQRVYMERFKNRTPDGSFEDLFYQRQTVAEVSADQSQEVIARVVSDTDGELKPKKVSGNTRSLFGIPRFLELLFFPLYPEMVGLYDVTDLGVSVQGGRAVRILRLYPKPGTDESSLVEGLIYLDPSTGSPLKLTIDRLHHFEALDSKLKGLLEFSATVTYRTLPNGVTVPAKAEGQGFSKITRYNGYFRFKFEEWGYHANPLYPDVNPWFDKMPGFQDGLPPAAEPAEGGSSPDPPPDGDRP
jgi:hypothetical protein